MTLRSSSERQSCGSYLAASPKPVQASLVPEIYSRRYPLQEQAGSEVRALSAARTVLLVVLRNPLLQSQSLVKEA